MGLSIIEHGTNPLSRSKVFLFYLSCLVDLCLLLSLLCLDVLDIALKLGTRQARDFQEGASELKTLFISSKVRCGRSRKHKGAKKSMSCTESFATVGEQYRRKH